MLQKIKLLELFGGIGSPRKAIENLNLDIKHIDYVEWWDHAVIAYNRLFENKFQTQNVLDWNLNVDILVHGSPCQDFSVAGKNDISSGRSILYRRTLEIIEEELKPRPKVVIWENVKGLLSKKNFPHFQHYLDSMEKMGYVNHYKVLNSKNFGIPQSRNRIFTVSILKDQTKFNNNFDFEKLELTEMKKLKTFLDKEVDKKYYITQKSMMKAIEQGKIKIVDNIVETITTKQIRWNNAGVAKVPLRNFEAYKIVLDPDKAIAPTLTTNHGETAFKVATEVKKQEKVKKIDFNVFNQESCVYMPDNDKSHIDTLNQNPKFSKVAVPINKSGEEIKWDENGIAKVSLHKKNFNSTDFVHNIEGSAMHTIGTNSANNRIAIPIFKTESKDFSNFKTLPRQSDGEVINGAHNRYWKTDKYVGTVAASATPKILVEVNKNYDYRLSDGSKRPIGSINKEGNITIPITTNHTANKIGVDVAMTLTTQSSSSKVLVEAIEPIPGIPIFLIDGKYYHLRVLTERECWRLMGWQDKDIDKVIDMPKTHLYHMAGNAIVIQVLEAIFKELIKG